ncbi:hypothetical protein [Roseibium sp.]|uniref:hypothetical protein n=1 Tax=Roseibium sp. TaxID=1936156 RepID=UPI003B507E86
MRDELEHTLSGWNGKATQPLKTAYETLRTEPDLVDLLIDLSENQSCERGATWLLKYAFDRDPPTFSNAQSAQHLAGISGFSHWETRLHFLQYLERLTIPDDAEAPLLDFILDALAAENRFLRAWAYFGLALHSERFPAHRDQAIDRLNEAMARETAGSVTVRIRKALERIAP